MLALLRRRSFGLLWFGGLISVAGDWVLAAALPFFVYQRTGSTVATAGMIVAELLPHVVLGTVAGVFVDRWDRRLILVWTNVAQAATVAVLILVADPDMLWLVYAVAAVQSALAAMSGPAETSLVPALVEDEMLVPANALNGLNNRLARLLGLPLGGVLLTVAGIEAVILVDVASFLAAAALFAGMQVVRRPPEPGHDVAEEAAGAVKSTLAEWQAGMRIMRRRPEIRTVFVILGIATFSGTMLDPLSVAWVRDVLGQEATTYALLMTTHAVAGIVSSALIGRFGRTLTPRALMGWGSVMAGFLSLAKYNIPLLPVAYGTTGATGLTSVASSIGVDTHVQRVVPTEYQGRVFGALGASGALLSLLGAAVGGIGGEIFGVVPMLTVAALLIVLSGVIVLRSLPNRDRSEDSPLGRRVVPVTEEEC
jgi:MFS family permease